MYIVLSLFVHLSDVHLQLSACRVLKESNKVFFGGARYSKYTNLIWSVLICFSADIYLHTQNTSGENRCKLNFFREESSGH